MTPTLGQIRQRPARAVCGVVKAVRFAAEQKIELILPFGKDMLWSVWVIISAPQMEQQTDDGNDDDYDGYCRKIM